MARCHQKIREAMARYGLTLRLASTLTSALFGHVLREDVHKSLFGHAILFTGFVRGIGITLSGSDALCSLASSAFLDASLHRSANSFKTPSVTI